MAETVVKTRMPARPSSVPAPWGEAGSAPRNTLTSKLFRELMDRWDIADETALLAGAAQLSAAQRATAPLFLPYLSGERSPHNDAQAQGVLFGLAATHGPADIAYAVVEGVSLGLRDGLDTLERPVGDLALVGGGARSAWWAQLLADILEVPLALGEGGEAGGALGAARLAWLADGGTVEVVCQRPALRQRFVPDATQADGHLARHAQFKALYLALRASFRAS